METLIFIDTNIFLDFYRYPKGTAVLSVLKHIDNNHNKIINSNQVEMEFKKNRQGVISDYLTFLKGPEWSGFQIPVILSETQPVKMIDKNKKVIKQQLNKLKKTVGNLLNKPEFYDRVYKTTQRLFKNNSKYNLTRDKKIRLELKELAKKRFLLGYPPRKDGDTSIGDAINWEWVIYCSNEYKKNIVIVTRDSDYGELYNKEPILNDWLKQEFHERVSKKRKITITNKLTYAFELASIKVNKKEIEDEERLINDKMPSQVKDSSYSKMLSEFEKNIRERLIHNDLHTSLEALFRTIQENRKKND